MLRKGHLLMMLAAGWLLAACADHSAQEAREQARRQFVEDSMALKVAVMPTLDCLPLFVAQQADLFAQQGLDVRLMEYQAQMDQDTAVERGHVEGLATDSVRAEWLRRKGVALQTVGQTSLKWQLISNKTARIKLLVQLDDKMVAMTRYSATDSLAKMAVKKARLIPDRVFRIQVNDVNVRLAMLETGVMDAMLLPEPQATQARLGGHHVLLDTDSLGLHWGILAFTREAMADTMRQRQVETFLKVYRQACDSIAANGYTHYRELIAARCHVNAATVDSLDVRIEK